MQSHLSFFRLLILHLIFFSFLSLCVMCKNFNCKECFGSHSSSVLYCRNCRHQQNAAISRSVYCCILHRQYSILMTDYLSSYRNTFIFYRVVFNCFQLDFCLRKRKKILKYNQYSSLILWGKKKSNKDFC